MVTEEAQLDGLALLGTVRYAGNGRGTEMTAAQIRSEMQTLGGTPAW
jgi:hypothetical protein